MTADGHYDTINDEAVFYDEGDTDNPADAMRPHDSQSPHSSTYHHHTKPIRAFRPRLIFCPLFAWNAITGGKFIAPMLEHLSPNFTEGMIGLTLSIQYAIVALLAGWGGRLADMEEKQSSWGWGRLKVLCWGILIGTISFLGHNLPAMLRSTDGDDALDNSFQYWDYFEMTWHIAMRSLWAVSFVLTAPAMDGLTLAHLECIDGASQMDFGKERMWGAAWWGLGSLVAGFGVDYCGFDFLSALAIVFALGVYFSVSLYMWGLNRDSTGAFSQSHEQSVGGLTIGVELGESHQPSGRTETPNEDKFGTKDLFLMMCPTCYGSALIFFIFTFAIGLAVVDNLAFIFFEFLGASEAMNGLTVVFTVIFELPLFYLSPHLLQRYGPGKLLVIAGVAYVIRVFGYTLVPEGHMWVILLLESLHGVSYACSKTGSVEFVARVTPKGYDASGQGLLFTIRFLGVVVGLAVGGWAQEAYGPRTLYTGMAGTVGLGCLVLILAESCNKPISEQPDEIEKSDSDESNHLMTKSESACSSASAFADQSTEKWVRSIKYDSLNKYVKDW